jgi:hypothetical protein
MGVLENIANELVGIVPGLPYLHARNVVQRAWKDIRDENRWSFLVEEDALIAPAVISAGTVSVTRYSDSITADAAAKAELDAATLPVLTQRQFRMPGGPVYNIAAYDNTTGVITLDRLYQEATNASATYQVYRCYFAAPGGTEFIGWVSIMDPVNGYRFQRRNLRRTKQEIDRRDPQRAATGNPFWIAQYKYDAQNIATFELWPHPVFTAAISYQCLYNSHGAALVTADTSLPGGLSDSLLLERAKYHAYEWAQANDKPGSWPSLRQSAAGVYRSLLQSAKLRDEEMFLNFYGSFDDTGLSGPIDSAFMQNHALVSFD